MPTLRSEAALLRLLRRNMWYPAEQIQGWKMAVIEADVTRDRVEQDKHLIVVANDALDHS